MRIVIVDDEPPARRELRRLLAAIPDAEVVGEAGGVDEALARIDAVAPDLVLLDVQMPDGDGFALLERLAAVPAVIFTTAFDHYAVRAFEVNALDYLVKPIAPDRLAAALARVAGRSPAATDGRLGAGQRVFVRDGERCWFVAIDELVLLESEGNYTQLHFGGHRPLVARPLVAIEARLDPSLFFRINRRQIINLRHVASTAVVVDGGLAVTLTGGAVVHVSRRRARLLAAATRL